MENLSNKIESLLFYQAEPLKIKKLAEILETRIENIEESLGQLQNSLENRGIKIIRNEDSISLTTSPENSEIIEKIKKEEQDRELSKAALETLTIILYRSPIKRSDIDYIRGVNSQFSLRALLIKGLIEKETSKTDERTYLYKPSIDLISYLGISNIKELPEYESVNIDVKNFIENNKENEEQQ